MLSKRIIIFLAYCDGILFRTKKFEPDYRYTDNFISNKYADEIVIVDISKKYSVDSKKKFFDSINKIANNCFVPITVGGKIKTLEQIKKYQNCGADKILLGTLPYTDPSMTRKIISKYGSQFVTISIDVKKSNNSYEIFINNANEKINYTIEEYLKYVVKLNPGEILINSIDRDGSLLGFDIQLCKYIKNLTLIPVIASGGFGNWKHASEAFKEANLDGLCTSNIFHLTENSMFALKQFLKNEKINVR
jgi:cyclase